ncbi:MAG: glycyl-radical enzyme activating protein [Spirochaetales bacterium]|nr:glycyl-radical enzyme activating protein [Spirochaetales bacterium]
MNGLIFNLQRFSTKDGPGIRSTAFLKGCNLNCLWCHNPESINGHKELKYIESACVHCGACASACPQNCLVVDETSWHWEEHSCIFCGDCVQACPHDALGLWGEDYTPRQLTDELLKDREYYGDSGGGVTFSGGEALLQNEFLFECLSLLKDAGIHTAVDTALSVEWPLIEKVLPVTDLFLIDVKGMDTEAHLKNIGVEPQLIRENIGRMKTLAESPEVHVRIPLVKGLNDDPALIPEMIKLLRGWKALKRVELLSYHSLGVDKSAQLVAGGEQELLEAPDREIMDEFFLKLTAAELPVAKH